MKRSLVQKKARLSFWPRFLPLVAGTGLGLLAWPAWATCPQNATFSSRALYTQDVPVSQVDLAVSEGGFSATLDLALPLADAGLNISGGLSPIATVAFSEWQWFLRTPGYSHGTLSVSYQVIGGDGTPGVLTSVQDPSSKVQATVLTDHIDNNGVNYYGYIDLELDFGNAKQSGPYTGTITVFVDCE